MIPLGKVAMIPEVWFNTSTGSHLAALEKGCTDNLLEGIFGYFAIQIGLPDRDMLGASPINTKIKIGRSKHCDVRADPRSLPFVSSSVDLVLIVHQLEFTSHPEAIIREAFRVLRPEGQIILIGFNPAGLYGLRQRLDTSGQYPWHGNFIFLYRLRDWFALLGLTTRHGTQVGYAPPWLSSESDWLRDKFESAGKRWWPMFGGAYVIQAIKRVPAIRRITPAWRNKVKEAVPAAGVSEKTILEVNRQSGGAKKVSD